MADQQMRFFHHHIIKDWALHSSRDRICGLFRPTRSEQDDSNRPHFPATCLFKNVIEPTTGAIHRYTGSRKPVDWRTSQIWWPNVLTHKQKPDMLTIDDMQTYCKDVYLISLCNRWPMTFDDRSLQCHCNTGCCLSLIDYFLALFYKSNSLICRQGVSGVFYWKSSIPHLSYCWFSI